MQLTLTLTFLLQSKMSLKWVIFLKTKQQGCTISERLNITTTVAVHDFCMTGYLSRLTTTLNVYFHITFALTTEFCVFLFCLDPWQDVVSSLRGRRCTGVTWMWWFGTWSSWWSTSCTCSSSCTSAGRWVLHQLALIHILTVALHSGHSSVSPNWNTGFRHWRNSVFIYVEAQGSVFLVVCGPMQHILLGPGLW